MFTPEKKHETRANEIQVLNLMKFLLLLMAKRCSFFHLRKKSEKKGTNMCVLRPEEKKPGNHLLNAASLWRKYLMNMHPYHFWYIWIFIYI